MRELGQRGIACIYQYVPTASPPVPSWPYSDTPELTETYHREMVETCHLFSCYSGAEMAETCHHFSCYNRAGMAETCHDFSYKTPVPR